MRYRCARRELLRRSGTRCANRLDLVFLDGGNLLPLDSRL